MRNMKPAKDKKQATINTKSAGMKRAAERNAEREAEAIRSTAKIKDFSGRLK